MPIIKKQIAIVTYQLISIIILVMVLMGACLANSMNNNNKGVSINQSLDLLPAQEADLAKRANSGDSDAAFKLYKFYDLVQLDREKGIYWLTKAAEEGHVGAQYNLGYLYIYDERYKDLEKAKYWLKKAAPSSGMACSVLANAYSKGYFGMKDFAAARSYFILGAGEGNRMCWQKLAEYLHAGIGGKKDDSKAYYWISLEARCVDPRSIGGKETWQLREEIAQNLPLAELEKQWRRVDKYIQLVRSKKVAVYSSAFLEGEVKKETSDEGVKLADEREKEHRNALQRNKKVTKE